MPNDIESAVHQLVNTLARQSVVRASGMSETLLEGYRYANRRFYSGKRLYQRRSRSPVGLW